MVKHISDKDETDSSILSARTTTWPLSSVGRALGLHPNGRGFKSLSGHHLMKPKLIFFDCDGTLIEGNAWGKLHDAISMPRELEQKWWKDYYAGNLTFDQWLENIEDQYRKCGLTQKIFEDVMSNYTFNPNVKEVCKKLQEMNIPIAIVSSSTEVTVKKVADELGIDTWRTNSFLSFDESGKFLKFGYDTDDPIVKVKQITEICKERGIKPTETFFVGDSNNDKDAFLLTKHGILYKNHDPVLVKAAWRVIEDFAEILPLISQG
jgi:HAD superfamily phosphoserine phosphatase-like hydrolase